MTFGANGCTNKSDVLNVVNLSVEETISEGFASIYPNPIGGSFSILASTPGNYQIIDLSGRTLSTGSFTQAATSSQASTSQRGFIWLGSKLMDLNKP